MSDESPEPVAEPKPAPVSVSDWRKRHAYGWPSGSVRALMALIVFGALWAFLVSRPNQEVPEYLKDLLFIILGHYFAVRGREDQAEEAGPPPLFLPNGSVRLLLIAGFVGSAVLLYQRGQLLAIQQNPAVVTLLLVFGFLLGVVLKQVTVRLAGSGRRPPRFLEDARATFSLLAAILLAVVVWDQFLPGSPHWGLAKIDLGLGKIGLAQIAAALVGFYFGSRS